MASPPTASLLLYLCFLSALFSPISSQFPDLSPCSIIGDLLPDLNPCDVYAVPLAPCVGAMVFRSGKNNEMLTKACCDGAALVAKSRETRLGRLAVCGCFKDVFAQVSIVTPQNLRDILAKCSGVRLPVPNPDTSCIS